MSRTGRTPDPAYECPVCGATVEAPVGRETRAATSPMGPKSPRDELVVCPDCEAVIDGFCPH